MHSLQQQAQNFIQSAPYFRIIQSYGHLYFTGSYFLNIMSWRDIDMQLCLIEGQDAKEVLGTISSSLIKEKGIKKFQFIDFLNYPRPPMTAGFCFCFTAFDKAIEDFWKVGLWVLDALALQENQLFMNKLKEKMTLEHHALIMLFKNERTSLYGRPPKMASYYLYQAIVLENLTIKDKIYQFLRKKNVNI